MINTAPLCSSWFNSQEACLNQTGWYQTARVLPGHFTSKSKITLLFVRCMPYQTLMDWWQGLVFHPPSRPPAMLLAAGWNPQHFRKALVTVWTHLHCSLVEAIAYFPQPLCKTVALHAAGHPDWMHINAAFAWQVWAGREAFTKAEVLPNHIIHLKQTALWPDLMQQDVVSLQ